MRADSRRVAGSGESEGGQVEGPCGQDESCEPGDGTGGPNRTIGPRGLTPAALSLTIPE